MKKILVGILSVFMSILIMSHNTFAAEVSINAVPIWSNYTGTTCFDIISVGSTCSASGYLNASTGTVSVGSITFNLPSGFNTVNGKTIAVFNIVLDNFATDNNIDGSFLNPKVSSWNGAKWGLIDVKSFSQGSTSYRIQLTFIAESSTTIGSNGYIKVGTSYNNSELAFLKPSERISGGLGSFYYIEGSGTQSIVDAINNSSDTQAINEAKDAIVGAIEEAQLKEDQAVDNIENQTQDSINNSGGSGENSSTTNLIGVLSNFVNALSGLSATNCDMVLAFPDYAGGSRTVNICQNKDKAGNLITVFSSLTMIMFYVPLAIKLLTMIYNEIRSFTNG